MDKKYVITIARGFGSGGKTIGQMLSERLSIPYYDNDILRLASEESGIHERFFGQVDEKLKSSLFKFGRSKVYSGELIAPSSSSFVSDDNLFNYQAKIIKMLAEKESCIIVGRCADFVLKDCPNVIRLFVFADEEQCITNICEKYGIDAKAAKKMRNITDKRRSEYYKYYTGSDWDNARNYDLSLNTANLGYEKCAQIVCDYLDVRFK